LITRAGFTLTTVDIEEIVINYPSIFELMDDLAMMGERNAVVNRPGHLGRDTLMAAAAIYKGEHDRPLYMHCCGQVNHCADHLVL
jgi:NADH dehydrogenase [ubiquinone] 1 alpha subcomplex assembly factor 5